VLVFVEVAAVRVLVAEAVLNVRVLEALPVVDIV
jgi:hypothetical protein